MRATVICCYNNEEQYQTFCRSLEEQDEKVMLIGMDNRGMRYRSCAEALNAGIKKADTKFVIFAHQDILFTQKTNIRRFMDCLEKIEPGDILGVAGARKERTGVYTNVFVDSNDTYAGEYRVQEMMECQTIDECFFGGYLSNFIQEPFDEVLCDNWHFYAVDRALNALINKSRVYVCDLAIIHASKGNINQAYHWGFLRLCKKYANYCDFIRTTIVCSKTNFFARWATFLKHDAGMVIKRKKA